MRALTDPRIFSFIILGLYACQAARWAWEGKWWQVLYWTGAFIITTSVTFDKH